jgi:hypothetical protein
MNGLPLTYRTSELQMRSKSVSLLHWMSGSLMRWMSGLLYRWYRLHERRRFLPSERMLCYDCHKYGSLCLLPNGRIRLIWRHCHSLSLMRSFYRRCVL